MEQQPSSSSSDDQSSGQENREDNLQSKRHRFRQDLENGKHAWIRMAFLFGLGLILSWSLTLAVIAPAPLVSALLLAPKNRGRLGLIALVLGQLAIFVAFFPQNLMTGSLFVFPAILALLIAEAIYWRWSPKKILLVLGSVLGFLGIGALLFAYLGPYGAQVKLATIDFLRMQEALFKKENAELLVTAESQLTPVLAWFEHPELSVQKLIVWGPMIIWASVFVILWISLFIVMRGSLLWRIKINYPYGIQDLLYFKAADWLLYPLLVALALAAGGELAKENGVALAITLAERVQYLAGFPLTLTDVGFWLMIPISVFYFFQGLGVYFSFMSSLKLPQFVVNFLVIMTLLTLSQFVAVLGVVDSGLNLRRFFGQKPS